MLYVVPDRDVLLSVSISRLPCWMDIQIETSCCKKYFQMRRHLSYRLQSRCSLLSLSFHDRLAHYGARDLFLFHVPCQTAETAMQRSSKVKHPMNARQLYAYPHET